MARPSSSERARRLLALLPYLGERGAVPLARLAEVAGTNAETVAADVTVLSMCGAGAGDPLDLIGVYVDGDTAEVFADLPALDRPVRLTAAEALALATALEIVGIDPGGALAGRLDALAGRGVDLEELARGIRSAFVQGGHAAVIAALSAAANERVSVRIAYEPAAGTPGAPAAPRVVRPFLLYLWRGAWYLLAYDEKRREERTFRVDRIASIASTGERFERPPGLPVSPTPLPDLESLPVATVRFDADAPDLSDREWPGGRFARAGDGSVTAKIPYAGTGWLARKVAARLGTAEVLFPEELRSAVAEAARHMLEDAHR